MRILLLSYLFNPEAGTELGIVKKWANAYSLAGHEVEVWTSLNQKKYFQHFDFNSVNFEVKFCGHEANRLIESPQSTFDLFLMRKNIKKWYGQLSFLDMSEYDLIHHVTLSTIRIISPLTSNTLNGFKVQKIWGPLGGGQVSKIRFVPRNEFVLEFIRNASIRMLPHLVRYQRFDKDSLIVLVTNEDTKKYASILGFKNLSLELSDGIEERNVVNQLTRKQPPDPQEEINFLWAGRIVGSKRLDIAIKTIGELVRNNINAKLYVAGDGPARASMKKLTKKMKLEDRVFFLGKIPWPNMNSLIDTVDFTIFSSVRDNSAPIILESAARGVPTIALRIQGVSSMYPETVAIGPETLTSSKEIHLELASHIMRIIHNPSEYSSASQDCLNFARTQTWKEKVTRLLQAHKS